MMVRSALVTGVSRRAGIGFAVARRLGELGFDLLVHSWAPHDEEQSLADPIGVDAVVDELRAAVPARRVEHVALDFSEPSAPAACVAAALERVGPLDVVVANHARSSEMRLDALTAAELDLASPTLRRARSGG